MKIAEVLVVGSNPRNVAKLRDVTDVSPEGLEPYQNEIRAIEDMYKSIWQLHVFLESSWFDKQPVVAWALERELGFPNDRLLTEELVHERRSMYTILAEDLRDEVAPKLLPDIVRRVDQESTTTRLRHGQSPQDPRAWLRRIIKAVNSAQRDQLRLPDQERPA